MRLLSIFQRQPGDKVQPPAAEANVDTVQQARTRARRRLIGASVLVVIGVIGFPLLFETQPRPIPVDIPIEIPRKDGAPPLTMPAARPAKPVTGAAAEVPAVRAPAEIVTETQADAGRDVPPAPPKPASAAAHPAPAPAKAADAKSTKTAAPKPATGPASTPVAAAAVADARRAQALLQGKASDKEPAKDGARFVVQVGAFADTAAARDVRQKVEKLGLKTYTQVADTSQGQRIRVRVGPFATRDDADRAQAKIKAAGSPAVVLTL
jgi:DedD protein